MTRKTYVQIEGVLYEKGTEPVASTNGGKAWPTIMPDLPDFVSPIDGKRYSGRTGLRDHCARHNVVPTADLAGLPIGRPPVPVDRKAIREKIVETIHRKGHLSDQL